VTDELLHRLENRVAVITLNRPERLNAMTKSMMQRLVSLLAECGVDDTVGCVVLTGAGRAFCTGGDVRVQASTAASGVAETPERRTDLLRASMEASRLLHEMPKPTIAMVNGPAAGAGLSLALACDLRVAAQSARFITAFAKVGFSGDFGGSYFLAKLVGTGKARELYYTAEPLDAAQALALGIANHVVADSELHDTTMALARKLAKGPRIALALMKRHFNAAESGTLAELLDLEAQHQVETGRTSDHKEAARAFVEKRAPVFTGR
jgi:2-(1,2-epoxy-1,2-dihydrophenyl)acetyl-CoA isomerase